MLMSDCIEADPGLTERKRDAFEAHLRACSACRRVYEREQRLIALLRQHWGPVSIGIMEACVTGIFPRHAVIHRLEELPQTFIRELCRTLGSR